ncbi:MAG: hypothetical protein DWQ34_05555 [Planctomycetota bacterium]|nr:MAG: hypothetical protein DWQ34_05555 [Planctomycetota bacterium]REK29445.1 MAG: hypothetical protein DWQ45_23035 [Planctomycetota bacterium]
MKLKDPSKMGRKVACPQCRQQFVPQSPSSEQSINMTRPDEFGDDLGEPVGSASAPQRSRGRSGGKRSKKKGQGSSTAKVVLIVLGVMGILGLVLVIGVGFWIYNAVSAGVDQLEQTVAETDFEQLIDEGVSELESAQQQQLQNALAPQASPRFATPQEAFDAMTGGIAARDWSRAASCMTDESQEMMAAGLLFIGGFAAAFGGDETAQIAAVLEKHGIDIEDGPEVDTEGEVKLPIRNKPAFIADMLSAMEASGEGFDEGPAAWAESSTLADLSIDGDKATASVVSTTDGVEEQEPIEFRRANGAWLVHLPEESFQMAGGPGEIEVSSEFTSPGFSGPGEFMDEPDGPLPEEALTLEQAAEMGLQISLHLTREEPLQVFGFFPDDAVFALLSFRGPLVASSFEYGHFGFDAVDDTGRKLTLAEPLHGQFGGNPSAEFIELDHFFLERPNELVLAMGLTGPARGAKQMKSFNGSLKLKARTTFVVDNVRSKVGETLDDEHLKAAGPFMIVQPTKQDGDANSTVVVVCRGDLRQQHDVRLIDSEGQEYHTAVWRHHSDDESRYVLESTEPLPDDIGLRITLAGSARELTIPFEFEDIALNEGTAVMHSDAPQATSSDTSHEADHSRVIPGSYGWDLEADIIGTDGETIDLIWRYRNETERGLVAQNGGALVRIENGEFDKLALSDLEKADYPSQIIPGSLNNNRLRPGTVLGLRTAEGNYAKLRVKGYVPLHDFSFEGSSVLTEDWKVFVLKKPNRTDYHIELEWELFKLPK